ncbi:hypothetical protein [Polycladomyces subterraneus]|uniref:Uncharacterized protein n=1 Tax=Polycladomyces subterraneus TaxID=1016997 RepID=A0ABT8IMV1_9BACL|nr:hypothetical protein [Polycladomyces subterraneus]MDN4594072.1 hypothetical protein [Polycladomyces subterraneus]
MVPIGLGLCYYHIGEILKAEEILWLVNRDAIFTGEKIGCQEKVEAVFPNKNADGFTKYPLIRKDNRFS